MFVQIFYTVGLMVTSVLASGGFSPVHHFGAMQKRQDGYYPTTSYCGPGDTCEVSCGPTYKTCPSKADLYCYDPSAGDQCCPDMSGNSCDEGYYCTNDPAGITYCCPNDLDLSNCAVAYSLTVSLIRQTAPPSASAESSVAAPTSTSLIHVSMPPKEYPTASYSTPLLPTGNATYTGSTPPEFTGGAVKKAQAGAGILAGAVFAMYL